METVFTRDGKDEDGSESRVNAENQVISTMHAFERSQGTAGHA